jgi:catechol 2,3-dioxygenase-like lactoylglutathione lyase family enzyme
VLRFFEHFLTKKGVPDLSYKQRKAWCRKTMNLGTVAQMTVSTPHLETSSRFYTSLGFQLLEVQKTSPAWALFTDGILLLLLQEAEESGAELTYYTDEALEARIEALEAYGITFHEIQECQAKFMDPSGLMIHLIQHDTTSMQLPSGTPLSRCGSFYEISLETSDLKASIAFWNRLGFEVEQGDPVNTNWVNLKDSVLRLGLYQEGTCPHVFRTPAFTYFAADMAERIAQFKAEGFTFVQEMAQEGQEIRDAILETPEGLYFFLFYYPLNS